MKQHTATLLNDYRPPAYGVESIDLTVDLFDHETLVTSRMILFRNPEAADDSTPLTLDCVEQEIRQVVAEDMVLLPEEYKVCDGTFTLARVPERFNLEITSSIKPQENTSMTGLYRSGGTFCTQCEAEGFRKITPFPDRPDVMSRFTCTIIADKKTCPVLLSNGNLKASGDLDAGRHYAVWEDPFRKPSYLFALVAGDLVCIKDTFTTCSGRIIDLHIYVEAENKDKCDHAMTSLKQAMAWDEERFGREYDLDLYQIVAVNDFNMGAMENKGLNIFNSKYVLARPETATDIDFVNIQSVVAHEYFHNWTGNRVTLKNWFQLSLKEGLTVFRDQEFSSDLNSRPVKRISDVRKLRAFQFPEDSGPMAHPVRPESYIEMNNFYTMTVYDKGAEVIRMMYQLLGRKGFRKGMDLYFERFDGQAVTVEDFVRTMEDVSGLDLTQFTLWYSQSGTPQLTLNRAYDPDAKQLTLQFRQTVKPDRNQPEKQPMVIPIKIGLIAPDGQDVTPEENDVFVLSTPESSLVFEKVEPGSVPSVLREFSAPVRLKADFSDEELAFLMARDTDHFNRWDAAQQLFFRQIDDRMKNPDDSSEQSDLIIQAFKKALFDPSADRSLTARTLALPDETEIGDQYDIIDVDAIHAARSALKKDIAIACEAELNEILELCSAASPTDLSFAAMADRSLKNLALSYLSSLGRDDTERLVFDRFAQAGNMTDELACLSILADLGGDLCSQALERFYHRWQDDPLVIDKWFSVQAAANRRDTTRQVKKLLSHPDFTQKNPNRFRSLISVYAFQNPIGFHHADGDGYRLVSDQVKLQNRPNPQIAARLVSAFNRWRRYGEPRRSLMEKELRILFDQEDLSRDVYEIVSRALD